MACTSPYALVPLIDRKDLAGKCIDLLNEEWPRSHAARAHSQEKSMRSSPPMSLLLIDTETDILIGHARVCHLPNRPTSCWVESVIVRRVDRGKGLGKILMTMTETFVQQFGFDQAFLSTDDKMEFYRSCGYTECAPILHSTATTSVFSVMAHVETDVSHPIPPKEKTVTSSSNGMRSSLAPPPPPPPPAPLSNREKKKDISTINHQYMHKTF